MSGTRSVLLDQDNQIIDVEYSKDPTWSYRVRYIDATTRQDIIDPETVEVGENTRQVIVNSPSVTENAAFEGYTLVSPAQVIVTREDAQDVTQGIYTITFEYVKQAQTYTVEHQLQMLTEPMLQSRQKLLKERWDSMSPRSRRPITDSSALPQSFSAPA